MPCLPFTICQVAYWSFKAIWDACVGSFMVQMHITELHGQPMNVVKLIGEFCICQVSPFQCISCATWILNGGDVFTKRRVGYCLTFESEPKIATDFCWPLESPKREARLFHMYPQRPCQMRVVLFVKLQHYRWRRVLNVCGWNTPHLSIHPHITKL